ncbi:MAG: hypothetical protein J0L64_11025 [Acidobacteria bacterium]|nr:hypothetical protein [Acidobacteriota bacterium]
MKTMMLMASCLALAVSPAAALDQEFAAQLLESAKNIERDAGLVSTALKSKAMDAGDVRTKIDAMSGDVTKLQELVSSYEAGHPQMSQRDAAEWKQVKEKVQLLEIFHGQKQKLASGDLNKNRTLLRAHAEGVSRRALKLQQTVTRLQKGPLS